jgi:hypothetical protein
MFRILVLFLCVLTVSGCGPSKEELRRQQLLEAQRVEDARREAQKLAAERDARIQERLNDARAAWTSESYLNESNIEVLFSGELTNDLRAGRTYFIELELQAAKYNYTDGKQSFVIVGMRNLPNSSVYSPLFPDRNAAYQPGQKAKSVLEFTLKNETVKNRLDQTVEKEDGKRWVAAALNFKDYEVLATMQSSWRWEPGLFEDLSWLVNPETAYKQTSGRSLTMQIGYRFCPLQRCRLEYQYRQHPISAIRADVMSVLVGNRSNGQVLAEFVREDK